MPGVTASARPARPSTQRQPIRVGFATDRMTGEVTASFDTIPSHPSNRQVIARLEAWGCTPLRSGNGWAHYRTAEGRRITVRAADYHEGNNRKALASVVEAVCDGDVRLFWAHTPHALFSEMASLPDPFDGTLPGLADPGASAAIRADRAAEAQTRRDALHVVPEAPADVTVEPPAGPDALTSEEVAWLQEQYAAEAADEALAAAGVSADAPDDVAGGGPDQRLVYRGVSRAALAAMLGADAGRVWTADTLAVAIDVPARQAASALSYLARAGLITRMRAGAYATSGRVEALPGTTDRPAPVVEVVPQRRPDVAAKIAAAAPGDVYDAADALLAVLAPGGVPGRHTAAVAEWYDATVALLRTLHG
jgi:hypothetical protein